MIIKYFLAGLLAFGALSVAAPTASADRKTVKVSKVTYNNRGSYDAMFRIRFNTQDGHNCEVYVPNKVITDRDDPKREINLMGNHFKIRRGPDGCLTDGEIASGTEIWGLVWIATQRQSCRKSKRLVTGWRGKTVHYHTRGTAVEDNRCRYRLSRN